jgi:glyoxylase-like metal-dependent hydrolase (beta-lactamase superfamily II)
MEQEIIRIDLQGVNCYLGKEGDKFILFDTGGHMTMDKQFTNRREPLIKELEKAGFNENNLSLILLTHGDNDHTANAAFIREKYKTKIAMHAGDKKLVENPTIDDLMTSFNYRSLFLRNSFVAMKDLIVKVTNKTLDNFDKFTPDILVDEGFDLAKYGFQAKVVNLPGHTDGSIGILTNSGELIAGDTFVNISKPEIASNANNFKQLRASVKKLKSMNIKTVYPGHGAPFAFNDF